MAETGKGQPLLSVAPKPADLSVANSLTIQPFRKPKVDDLITIIKRRIPPKYLGAFKCGHRKCVREYIDDELAYELLTKFEDGDKDAAQALEWLAKYNNEFYKGFLKKGDPNAIHNTDVLYKEATDSQNAKRRDLIGAVQSGALGPECCFVVIDNHISPTLEHYLNQGRDLRHEDHMVDLISRKTSLGL